MTQFLSVMGAIILAGLWFTYRAFRKGGIYNPTMPDDFTKLDYLPENKAINAPVASSTPPIADITQSTPNAPQKPISSPTQPELLDWSNPISAKHAVRVICDQEGLDLEQKNTLCATIGGESGWKTSIIHPNYVIKNGVKIVSSTDYGICQWNDYWHGKEISPDEALHNPEKAVRLMCTYWKQGLRNQWCAYQNGSYKHYLT